MVLKQKLFNNFVRGITFSSGLQNFTASLHYNPKEESLKNAKKLCNRISTIIWLCRRETIQNDTRLGIIPVT
jgi:hypothetical protein